jgi:hypothetical protein
MDKASSSMLSDSTPENPLFTSFLYTVSPGDTLSKIIQNVYGVQPFSDEYKTAVQYIRYFNPRLDDINRIYPGQNLYMAPLPKTNRGFCPNPLEEKTSQESSVLLGVKLPKYHSGYNFYRTISRNIPKDSGEREAFRVMAMLENNYNLISNPPGVALGTLGYLTSQQNNAFLQKVEHLYRQYKSGMLTQNQYNYQRRLALKEYAKLLGPFEKVLYKGKHAREAIRISRAKAIPANAKIAAQAERLNRLAKLSKHGGVMLMGAGLYLSCQQIKSAQTNMEKNDIFVETVASTIGGVGFGVIVSIALASTPVGWGVALILSAGSAAIGYDAGKITKWIYDTRENHVDFVDASGVGYLCK